MPQTDTHSIALSKEHSNFLKQHVATGEFPSESEVIATALVRLKDEFAERRRWEQKVLVPTLERLEAEPESGIPIDQLIEHLAERRRQRVKVSA